LPGHRFGVRLSDGWLCQPAAILFVFHAIEHAERLFGRLFRLVGRFIRLERRRFVGRLIEQHAERIERRFPGFCFFYVISRRRVRQSGRFGRRHIGRSEWRIQQRFLGRLAGR
jgi:hypothetical protein